MGFGCFNDQRYNHQPYNRDSKRGMETEDHKDVAVELDDTVTAADTREVAKAQTKLEDSMD